MDEQRTYSLMLFDDALVDFTLVRDTRTGVSCVRARVEPGAEPLLPFRMTGSPESVEHWLRARSISKNRAFATRIVRQYGIHLDDPIELIDACMALSLNDAYWVKPAGSTAMFADKSLYSHDFDELVATVAFSGGLDTSKVPLGQSGELTTSGQFPKAWRIVNAERCLCKAGSVNTNGLEPHAEYYAAQLAEAMGLAHVPYNLDEWQGKLCCICPLFTSETTGFASFAQIFGAMPFEDVAGVYAECGKDAGEFFGSMAVFDALIANDDRHLNNFGFLFDNATRRIIAPAPAFDHNLALFMRDIDAGLSAADLAASVSWYKGPMEVTLDYQAGYFMTSDMKDRIAALRRFEFEPHARLPLSDATMQLLNDYLQLRVEHLLDMPTVDEGELSQRLRDIAAHRSPDPLAPPLTLL